MPQSLDLLKENIRREFKNISKDTLKNTFDDFYKRLEILKTNGGGHVEVKKNILFKGKISVFLIFKKNGHS